MSTRPGEGPRGRGGQGCRDRAAAKDTGLWPCPASANEVPPELRPAHQGRPIASVGRDPCQAPARIRRPLLRPWSAGLRSRTLARGLRVPEPDAGAVRPRLWRGGPSPAPRPCSAGCAPGSLCLFACWSGSIGGQNFPVRRYRTDVGGKAEGSTAQKVLQKLFPGRPDRAHGRVRRKLQVNSTIPVLALKSCLAWEGTHRWQKERLP